MAKPLFIIIFILITLPLSLSQSTAVDQCNGIFLSYNYTSGYPIPPNLVPSDPSDQPYRFESILTILNNGLHELKSWRVYVGFEHGEVLVSASNAVLDDGRLLPADVGNGTVFSGFPERDLKTAVETAGDMSQMGAKVQLVGTQFGEPDVPLPSTITLANDGFSCPNPTKLGSWMHLCCTEDSTSRSNITIGEDFEPLQINGDVSIMYDVIRSYENNYWAQVAISIHNPLHRLDNWKLSWEWKRDEFIYAMKGAYPSVVDSTECIFGRQGEHYKEMDFSNVLNCERRPTIIDLPPTMADNSVLGMIPFCCRNGTILPPSMDETKSASAFQMQVFKMPNEFNRTQLIPPQNWNITGEANQDYRCAPPVRVSPTRFPNPTGLSSESTAIASWQMVCNKTESKGAAAPRCCVSFSAFFNDSVVPCNTCACGCKSSSSAGASCSASAPALLLPSEALLVPFDNRTRKATEFARLHHWTLPKPLPCGDNCGVSINWHINTDYEDGWTARITLFNWEETDIVDWFATVEFDKAVPGFQTIYSFNGTALPPNNTIFMQGKPGLNYLLGEKDGKNPKKNLRIPGTQQSVLMFTKKTTPGIEVGGGDGFPTKVLFNGEECSLPSTLPSNAYRRMSVTTGFFGFLLAVVALLFSQFFAT